MEFFGNYNAMRNAVELYIKTDGGKRFVSSLTISVEDITEASKSQIRDPSWSLGMSEAQSLMQVLWNSGLRPNNGEGTNAQADSIKYHLEDMRKLVFRESND